MNLFNFFNFLSHAHNKRKQADAALCTRIAENGADAQPCLSDVYKISTRAKRRQADVPLYAISSGRSMVEMLGVLAIIGVLSVGAIAGYSKAMFKYRLNKFSETMNMLLNNALQISKSLPKSTVDGEWIPIKDFTPLTKLSIRPVAWLYSHDAMLIIP